MNTFAVKAIILSAIVAYYGQCEGQDYHYAVIGGQEVECQHKGEKAVAACCVGGTLVCPETRTRKWQNSKEICLDQGGALCEYTQLQDAPNSCGDTQWSLTECDPTSGAQPAQSNSRESIASPLTVSTSNGAEGSGFDVVSAMIGCAVGAVLMLLAVYVVIVVRRKRMSAKSDEEAIVKEQTNGQVQETPANVVAVVETVIETEME